jgi:peptide/nickel transport system ATP-binding protein
MERDILLEIRDLAVEYHTDEAIIYAINHINLSVKKGETIGLVGETGAGKNVHRAQHPAHFPVPPAKIISGEIFFNGATCCNCAEREMRKIRGNKITMIFQDPMTALNPIETVGFQIAETIKQHNRISRAEAHKQRLRTCLRWWAYRWNGSRISRTSFPAV